MHGLNTYDYGARQHDPILARWDRIDPLCEKFYSTSPYNYCLNNPVKNVDPDGKKPHNWNALFKSGKIIDLYHEMVRNNCAYHNRDAYDDNVVNIWIHGVIVNNKYSPASYLEMGVQSDSKLNGHVSMINKSNVSKFVNRLDEEDKGWRNNKINGYSILVLHSCRAAILAKELSGTEELKDVVVIAPYTTLISDKYDGERVMDRMDPKTWKKTSGVWGVFFNGKPVLDDKGHPLTYSATAQPGTKGFDYKLSNLKSSKK